VMVPAKSRPGMRGKLVNPNEPLELRMSLGWIAEAWTLIRRWFGLRVGFGSCSRERTGGESEVRSSWRAFIVVCSAILRDDIVRLISSDLLE